MKKFLDYIYTDKIEGNDTDLLKVIYVAHKYIVPRLVSECAVELIKKITKENAIEILKAGYLVENDPLLQKAMEYLKKNELLFEMRQEWNALEKAYPALASKVAQYYMFQNKW